MQVEFLKLSRCSTHTHRHRTPFEPVQTGDLHMLISGCEYTFLRNLRKKLIQTHNCLPVCRWVHQCGYVMCLYFDSNMKRHFHTHILHSKNKVMTSKNSYFSWSANIFPPLSKHTQYLNNFQTWNTKKVHTVLFSKLASLDINI